MSADYKNKCVKDGFAGQRMFVLPPHIKRSAIQNPMNRNFYVTAAGYYPKALGHERERRYGSNEYILIYCTAGTGDVSIKGSSYSLKADSYLILPPNITHKYRSSTTEPWSIYWMHFNGGMATEINDRSLVDSEATVHRVKYDVDRIHVFDELLAVAKHSYNKREMEIINFHALHFVTSLVYHRETDPDTCSLDTISNSIAFMKDNITLKCSLKELAKQQNISVTHYSKMFKKKTGTSPLSYFNGLKVQRSCQEMYFTDKSIKTICAELGFDDQYYFSRLFSKVTGVSPSKYKLIQKSKPQHRELAS
jgi:AraC family transcriptional regulator of arabinose operon